MRRVGNLCSTPPASSCLGSVTRNAPPVGVGGNSDLTIPIMGLESSRVSGLLERAVPREPEARKSLSS